MTLTLRHSLYYTCMTYTVSQLAKISGVTPRTLHHYDAIGLLSPSKHSRNGYRYYDDQELLRLQQILFFRELDFSLADIKKIIGQPEFDVISALHDHKKLIELKQKRLKKLTKTIDTTIKHMTHKQSATNEELYDVFKDTEVIKYQEEVKQRWGATGAYKQSMARVGKMSKAEMEELKKQQKELTQQLVEVIDKPIESDEVQELIRKHHQGIEFFYDCPLPMYRNVAQMYVDDSRFAAYYEAFHPGLAQFIYKAIQYYCDNQKTSE